MRLLYLAHRIPYPPNKGDKIRSYNELAFLCQRYEVDLVCFLDAPGDEKYLPKLREMCRSVSAFRRGPLLQVTRLLRGFLTGEPLSVALYDHPGLRARVRELTAAHDYARIFIFSGQMAQYADSAWLPRTVIDFCDVDSYKWDNYADRLPFYSGWFYRLEARRLLAFEKEAARAALAAVFITPAELDIFKTLGGEGRLVALGNGVDTEFFSPAGSGAAASGTAASAAAAPGAGRTGSITGRILFTGAMDYFPNEEGVVWFAREVLPGVRRKFPGAHFVIAGSNPTQKVKALARLEGVEVTGFVEDMRAEQAKAHVVVVPLRIARGMQNKVLEAMACGKAVVVARKAMGGIHAEDGRDLCVAESPEEFQAALTSLLGDPARVEAMGSAAREYILRNLSWQSGLEKGLVPLMEDDDGRLP